MMIIAIMIITFDRGSMRAIHSKTTNYAGHHLGIAVVLYTHWMRDGWMLVDVNINNSVYNNVLS